MIPSIEKLNAISGAFLSCVPAGYLINKWGRKRTLLASTLPSIAGWVLIIMAKNVWMMIVGRIFLGVSLGFSSVIVPVYIGEIAQKDTRGVLGTFFQLMLAMGVLFVYITGAFQSVPWLNASCLTVPLVFGILLALIPETPVFFVIKNKDKKAEKSLKWYRGRSFNINEELAGLQAEEKERQELNENRSIKDILRDRTAQKSLIIVIGLGILQQACGINVITFYNTEIFQEAKTTLSPSLQSIILGIMQLIMSFVATLIIEKLGRKVLCVGSALTMCLCLMALGFYFFVKQQLDVDVPNLTWLPVTCMSLLVCAFGVGIGAVSFILFGEICSNDIKGFAVGTAMTLNWLSAFFVTKFFTNLVQLLGIGPTFWIFSIFNFLGALFIFFLIPETKGRTLSEIQEKISRK